MWKWIILLIGFRWNALCVQHRQECHLHEAQCRGKTYRRFSLILPNYRVKPRRHIKFVLWWKTMRSFLWQMKPQDVQLCKTKKDCFLHLDTHFRTLGKTKISNRNGTQVGRLRTRNLRLWLDACRCRNPSLMCVEVGILQFLTWGPSRLS